jgi:signal transduction histidine kinase
MQLKDQPIRKKMMIILMLTSSVVVLSTCAVFAVYELITFRQSMISQLSTLGAMTADNSTAALAFDNQDDAIEVLSALKAETHIVAGCLYDKDGKIFARYPSNLPDSSIPRFVAADGYRFEESHLIAFQPVIEGLNTRLGTLYLKSDLGAIYDRFKLYAVILILVNAITILLSYIVSRFMQRQISEPILKLAETAEAVAHASDYSVRATRVSGGELGLLTDAFNQMLERISEQNIEANHREEQIRKLNEELELRVRERTGQLEVANKELEAFSYSVSHDLRAPLRHILGFGSLLQARAQGLDPSEQRYLGLICDSAKKMGSLIDDMLEFSRMGRVEMQKRTVDTQNLVREIIESLQEETAGRSINWKQHDLPTVLADPSMLRQVFVNLISNAVKYSYKKETAAIEIGAMHVDSGETTFFVRDNGVGFDMKYADKLFGVFQRLHRSDEFEGTGVGLANAARVVKRHGGRIWAEAEVDQGATFYFTVPKIRN